MKSRKIINLTNHPVTVLTQDGPKTFEPSGTVARVDTENRIIGEIDGIPIIKIIYKDIYGIPEPDGNIYIVSSVVKNALPDREDIVALYDVTRVSGKPICATGFRVNG